MDDFFCGWYFKCQSPGQTLALIPAVHRHRGHTTASIQLICDTGCWSVPVNCPHPQVLPHRPVARLGPNVFGPDGLRLDLQTPVLSARGTLRFGPPTPLRSDIMGPFRWVPGMGCQHSVYSMAHRVDGAVTVNGVAYRFDDGIGYLEGDRGRSFPSQYAWTHCAFPGGSLLLSAARIPFGPLHFTGVIAAVQLGRMEYRLATYRGARVVKHQDGEILVRQGPLELSARKLEDTAQPLQAPVRGQMSRVIRENAACRAQYRLTKHGQPLWALESSRASFEFEYPGMH